MSISQTQKTINDFGDQWDRYTDNSGVYGSVDYFGDILGPLATLDSFKGRKVLDIGSGTGRIVQMLLGAGAAHVVAVEPSEKAFAVMKTNTAALAERITYLNVRGDEVPADVQVDDFVSIGVIHHIPDAAAVMKSGYAALKPGGRCIVWLYGHEGNGLYLAIFQPLRWLTQRLPHFMLAAFSHVLNVILTGYMWLCCWLPLPLRSYCRNVLARLTADKRYLIIYDQLNPAYAKYYRGDEARALLEDAGFINVKLHHRHAYSWTVVGEKYP